MNTKQLFSWLRFGLTALAVIVGAVLFVTRSQASQDAVIIKNTTHIEGLTKAVNGSLERIEGNISAMSAHVSTMSNAIVRIETVQTAQAEDISELKDTAKELRDR